MTIRANKNVSVSMSNERLNRLMCLI